MERASRYGGNIRIHITNNLNKSIHESVNRILDLEKRVGLYKNDTYKKFSTDVLKSKRLLINFIQKILNTP